MPRCKVTKSAVQGDSQHSNNKNSGWKAFQRKPGVCDDSFHRQAAAVWSEVMEPGIVQAVAYDQVVSTINGGLHMFMMMLAAMLCCLQLGEGL